MMRSGLHNSYFFGPLVMSQIRDKDCKILQKALERHKMARSTAKCFPYCMGKFIWTRNLMVRTDSTKILIFQTSGLIFMSQTPKKGWKYPENMLKWYKWQDMTMKDLTQLFNFRLFNYLLFFSCVNGFLLQKCLEKGIRKSLDYLDYIFKSIISTLVYKFVGLQKYFIAAFFFSDLALKNV